MPFFCFFLFQAVDCLLNRTRVSDVVEKGTGAPTVEDTGADTNLGPALERKPKAPLSPPPGASKASQNNDVDIIDNEETPGLFEDFVKVDSSVHDFENLASRFPPRNAMLRVITLLCGLPSCFRATDCYRIIVPVIFCRVAVLFTLC